MSHQEVDEASAVSTPFAAPTNAKALEDLRTVQEAQPTVADRTEEDRGEEIATSPLKKDDEDDEDDEDDDDDDDDDDEEGNDDAFYLFSRRPKGGGGVVGSGAISYQDVRAFTQRVHQLLTPQGKQLKRSLVSFLPTIPGAIDNQGANSSYSLCSLLANPPVVEKPVENLPPASLIGFRLRPGQIPEQFRTAFHEKPKKKKRKKHHKMFRLQEPKEENKTDVNSVEPLPFSDGGGGAGAGAGSSKFLAPNFARTTSGGSSHNGVETVGSHKDKKHRKRKREDGDREKDKKKKKKDRKKKKRHSPSNPESVNKA